MKKFAVIGDPIAHSLSPDLHKEIYWQLGIEAEFEKIHIPPKGLNSFMNTNDLDGFNVTIPHKQTVIPFLDELNESAEIIGAVNCEHNGKGYNTDWIGFTMAMELNNVELNGKDCVILGAGGAARAVAYALIQSNVNSISIMNRTRQNADTLVKWIKNNSNISVNRQTHKHSNTQTLIINCTPLGMWPNTEAIPEFEIQKNQVLVDTIYNPIGTQWLKLGKRKGAKVIGGLDMFIAQGLASADIWFGEKISKKIKFDPLKKVLKLKLC